MKSKITQTLTKYFLPLVLASGLIMAYQSIIDILDINPKDIYPAIILALLIAAFLSSKIAGPKIPILAIQKLYEYYIEVFHIDKSRGPKIELSHLDRNNTFIAKYSKQKIIFGSVDIAAFFIISFLLIKYKLYAFSSGLIFLYGSTLINQLNKLLDSSPQLAMHFEGVVIKGEKTVLWKDIHLTELKDIRGSKGVKASTNFNIYTSPKTQFKHPEYSICIDFLDANFQEIETMITRYHRKAPEVI